MSFVKATVAAIAVAAVSATTAAARDQVHIAGSSTVLPYASIVAEAFGENFDFPTPIVEGGGSGAGRKRMCEGVGLNTIDIANSSSLMKEEQWTTCEATVGKVTEVRIGYDGITFSTRLENTGFEDLTPEQIYLALGPDKMSLAIRVVYRSEERTLTEEEVQQAEIELLRHLENTIGARLRSS